MKLIKLVMNAFGPYPGREEVNFQEFGEKGIFLITGDTGAGKTTIFDAITFALFNDASGEEREAGHLRSDFAALDEETFVEFTFSHMGREYKVYRQPTQDVAKKRGEGVTTKHAKAGLYREPDPPISGTNAVDKAIKELLRIDYNQFKQISMIAQGEFRKVLNADPKERGEILRRIFNTDGYRKMAESISGKAKKARGEMENIQRSVNQEFCSAQCGENSKHAEELQELKELCETDALHYRTETMISLMERLIEEDRSREEEQCRLYGSRKKAVDSRTKEYAIANQVNEDFARYDNAVKEKAELDGQREVMNGKVELLAKWRKALHDVKPSYDVYIEEMLKTAEAKKSMESAADEAEKADAACGQAEEALEKAAAKKQDAEAKREKATILEQDEALYSQRDELTEKISSLKESSAAVQKKIGKYEKEIAEKAARIAGYENRKKELSNADRNYILRKQELDETGKKQNELESFIVESYPKLKDAETELQKAQKEYLSYREEYDKTDAAYNEYEKAVEKSRAGILAELLSDGMPCPVCGSTEHPAKAEKLDDDISEDKLKELKASRDKAETHKNKAEKAAAGKKGAYDEAVGAFLINVQNALGDAEEVSDDIQLLMDRVRERYAEIKIKLDELSAALQKCAEEKEEFESLDGKIRENTEAKESLHSAYEELKNKRQQQENELASLNGQLDGMKPLEYAGLEDARKARKAFMRAYSETMEAIEAREKELSDARQNLSSARTNAENLKKQYSAFCKSLEEKQEIYADKRKTAGFAVEEDFRMAIVDKERITAGEEELQKYREKVAANEEAVKMTAEKIKDKTRIDEAALKVALEESKALRDEAEKALHNTIYRKKDNEKRLENIMAGHESSGEKMKEVTMLSNLANLFSGHTAGKNKTSFETYVQTAGFDGIIHAANKRLNPMSGGQYQLFRHEDLDAKTDVALKLDILDHYTGKKRSVSTLSGGESFLASLSLALGLSDKVSANAGGINIGSLFIDEGFGTLDEKTLGDALDTLVELSNSDKLIGIISHREELKAVIPKKLMIEKTNKGSRVSSDTGR